MNQRITHYTIIFFFSCIAGWLWECSIKYLQYNIFANRGVLHGPWLPIYGLGSIVLLLIYEKTKSNILIFFCLSIIACGILEFSTSVILESIFDARWWDYSNNFLNIQGRIYPLGLLAFALMGLILCRKVTPFIKKMQNKIPTKIINYTIILLILLFLIDIIFAVITPNMGIGITASRI